MPLEEIDTRPGGFVWKAYPGQVVEGTWGDGANDFPDGYLAGRTFEVQISDASGVIDTVAADVAANTVTATLTIPAAGRYVVSLWDTTGTPQIATWTALHSDEAAAAPPAGLTVPVQVVTSSITIPIDFHAASAGGDGEGGVTDHGLLTGLGDNDHPQYALVSALTAEAAARAAADTAEATARGNADALLIPLTQKGSASGVAELDGAGKVPSAQLPSFVDDVVEAANFAALPVTGETGKIYVTLDNGLTFRWSGAAYVEISASLALGETSATAYRGDRGKTAFDHSQLVSGNPHAVTKAEVGLSNVDNTSDANKPVSAAQQAALDAIVNGQVFTGEVEAPTVRANGQTGATEDRILSGGTASGPPASGTWVAGQVSIDDTGALYFCTVGGTPGTWVDKYGAAIAALPELAAVFPVELDVVTDPTEASFSLADVFVRRLFNATPTAAVSGTGPTSMLTSTYTMPADTVAVGDVLEIQVWGTTGNNVGGNQTDTIRIKWGASNLWTSGALTFANAGAATYPWFISMTMRLTSTAGGTWDPYGTMVVGPVTGGAATLHRIAPGTQVAYTPSGVGSAIDFTSAHDTASGAMLTTCRAFTVRRIPAGS